MSALCMHVCGMLRDARACCMCGVRVCGMLLCVYNLNRLLPGDRVVKLGVLPADTLTPLYRRALRYWLTVPRSLIAPSTKGAVRLWPRCPLKPLDLIMSRGFGCKYTCVCVNGILYGVCVLTVLWYVNDAKLFLLLGILCGLCIPFVLYCECMYGVSCRVCDPDSFLLSEDAVFLCFLPAKTLVPL